jgi:hypothetical protein
MNCTGGVKAPLVLLILEEKRIMNEALYLVFETDYMFEGEVFTYLTNAYVTAEDNDEPDDSELLYVVRREHTPMMAEHGCQLVEVRLHRLSEFEYKRYLKKGVLV